MASALCLISYLVVVIYDAVPFAVRYVACFLMLYFFKLIIVRIIVGTEPFVALYF